MKTRQEQDPSKRRSHGTTDSGRLRIGDHWNAISIIALSQTNPLKAVAEFVENSIDARAHNITIVRGKEKGQSFVRVIDDGEGVPKDNFGLPDFKYVATHVCDSVMGAVREAAFAEFCESLRPLEESLVKTLEAQQKAEEERASRQTLRSIQKAFREALLVLPEEDYDWFSIRGPSRNLRAVPRDRSGRQVEEALGFVWEILEGTGNLDNADHKIVALTAPKDPGLIRVGVAATQRQTIHRSEMGRYPVLWRKSR